MDREANHRIRSLGRICYHPWNMIQHHKLFQENRIGPHRKMAGAKKRKVNYRHDLGEYFSKDVKEYISQKHKQLHEEGMKNEQIYNQIQKELKERRFPGPELSVRQIRRVIYG